MFVGDRNSTTHAHTHDPHLRYLDPAALSRDIPLSTEFSEGDAIRLENYQPRVSPEAPRKNGTTVYAAVDVNRDGERGSEPMNSRTGDLEHAYVSESIPTTKKQREELNNLSKDAAGSSEDEDEPPDWLPPPPPMKQHDLGGHTQVDNDLKDRRTNPDNLLKGAAENTTNGRLATGPTSNEDSSEDDDVNNSLAVRESEPPLYSKVDVSKKKNRTASQESADSAKNGLLTNGSSLYDADTSEDDSMVWPPAPPPPQMLSSPPDDSDWERPLPPEIMALPGKRNRVASWANDE